MARFLGTMLCLIAAVGFVASPASAAVQNVKVGGDIAMTATTRDNFDLRDTRGVNEISSGNSDEVDSMTSQVRLRVDADLSDNVSTTIRLLNERVWNQAAAASEDIDIDLASVTMKEFLYSPLTLTLGRQELRYGNALIVGDPDTNIVAVGSGFAFPIQDLSVMKAFDAVKAVLDYNPLKIDLVFAKVDENTVGNNDDVTLLGTNLNYALDSKNTVLEAYYFGKFTGDGDGAVAGANTINGFTRGNKTEKIHTIGTRASTDPIENLNLQGEVAYQFGNYDPALDENAAPGATTARRSAWAAQVVADYKLKVKYDPRLTGTYSFFSGEDNNRTTGKFNGWNAMFEDQTLGDIANKIFSPSNAHVFTLSAQAKPAEDFTAQLTYAYLQTAKKIKSGGNVNASGPQKPTSVLSGLDTATIGSTTYNMAAGKSRLGQEVDLHLTYDYTEDVQIGLMAGVFLPGNAFAKPENRDPASQAILLTKVTF